MRDIGPTFVVDDERPGALGAVDWVFNGWGAHAWAQLGARRPASRASSRAAPAPSWSARLLVNEGGGIHVDGEGTVLLTETVQLDPRRNPYADQAARRGGAARARSARRRPIWLPRGLTRDYERLRHATATSTSSRPSPRPGRVLLHAQHDPAHPDYAVTRGSCAQCLAGQTDAAGRTLRDRRRCPPPTTLRDEEGFVDWSYVEPPRRQRRRDRVRLRRASMPMPGRARSSARPTPDAASSRSTLARSSRAAAASTASPSSSRRSRDAHDRRRRGVASPTCAPRSSRGATTARRAASTPTSPASTRTTRPAPRRRSTPSSCSTPTRAPRRRPPTRRRAAGDDARPARRHPVHGEGQLPGPRPDRRLGLAPRSPSSSPSATRSRSSGCARPARSASG